jgi:hypothetical protein
MTKRKSNTKSAPVLVRPGFCEGDVIQDVSNEESRLYVRRDGTTGSVVIERPLTFAIGEEGEHVFGLKNGCTLIVPPTYELDVAFVD